MSNYFIGDIHGCFAELELLLNKIAPAKTDNIYFAGDLVNRGPESLETLRLVKQLNCHMVLGNHDLYLLACYFKQIPEDYTHTFHRIMAAEDRVELIDWLLNQPLYHYFSEDNDLLVHAGFYPFWQLTQGLALADKVTEFMRAKPQEFFQYMFGSEQSSWAELSDEVQKRRFVINAFTRMRYVHDQGALDFNNHRPPPNPDPTLKPWYEFTRPFRVIFGHWSALGGYNPSDGVIALDGGCVWGNKLLAWHKELDVWYAVDCLKAS